MISKKDASARSQVIDICPVNRQALLKQFKGVNTTITSACEKGKQSTKYHVDSKGLTAGDDFKNLVRGVAMYLDMLGFAVDVNASILTISW